MKILHVVANLSPEWGGPTKVVTQLTESFVAKGIEVSVFSPVIKGTESMIVKPRGVDVKLFPQHIPSYLWTGYSADLKMALERGIKSFDIIHIHELWHHAHFASYRCATKNEKPYIITVHGGLAPWCLDYKPLRKKVYSTFIQRKILNKANCIHAISEMQVNHIRSFGIHSDVVVIPNGVNPEEYENLPGKDELENIYPEARGKKIILFLGRIHPIKGLDVLAKAFGRVAIHRNDILLLMVGPDNDNYQEKVEEILRNEGVLNRVLFTGMLTGDDKKRVLGGADIFVMPSYSEDFGISILEAMICGIPVIISRNCGISEYVADSDAGMVINSEVKELALAIIELLDDGRMKENFTANGKKLVTRRFTLDMTVNRMVRLYENELRKEKIPIAMHD